MRVVAVIVSYLPERATFIELLQNLMQQVDQVLVVDNSPRNQLDAQRFFNESGIDATRTLFIRLDANYGIAVALNVGIRKALELAADFVLLSDQDSLPAPDMVENLRCSYEVLCTLQVRVGAIGPTYTDLHTGLTYPFQANLPGRFFYGHKAGSEELPLVEALTLITSGTLIPVGVFEDVGFMREDFFIDQVDIEWCHRARWKGYRVFGSYRARMYQRMGEDNLDVWFLRWRKETAYKPLRIYYRIRNFIALWKSPFIDWRWKVRSSWYSLGVVYAHFFFSKYSLETLKMASLGLWDGIWGKMGCYRQNLFTQSEEKSSNRWER